MELKLDIISPMLVQILGEDRILKGRDLLGKMAMERERGD